MPSAPQEWPCLEKAVFAVWFKKEWANLRNAFSSDRLCRMASRNLSAWMREPSPATWIKFSCGERSLPNTNGEAGHSFSADEANFETFVAIACDNRSEPTLDKITVLDGLVGRFENLANLQLHRLQVRQAKQGPRWTRPRVADLRKFEEGKTLALNLL